MAGFLPLTSVKLFRLRRRRSNLVADSNHSSKKKKSKQGQFFPSPQSNAATQTNEQSYVAFPQATTSQIAEEERNDPSSPSSNSSAETIVFDPKIVNCRSLSDEPLEADDVLSVDDHIPQEGISGGGEAFQQNFQHLTTDLMTNFNHEPFNNNNLVSANAFANTVWSTEESMSNRTTAVDPLALTNDRKEPVPSFPEVEQCIPRWKKIFPWIGWIPWSKQIFCSICQTIHNLIDSKQRAIVVKIFHKDDVFKVSKSLRIHSDKTSHKTALILQNKTLISTIYFLINSHFNEFNSISEILTVLEDLLGKSVLVSPEILKCALSMLGEYLEHRVLTSLKKVKKFSVITDPCAGLLIVRWLNDDNEPEEHIISSFNSVIDKTPNEYLTTLGVNIKYQAAYATNVRCEECTRCKLTRKLPHRTPTSLRLPQLDRYLVFLWRRKLLKPFYSLGSSLCKLWLSFPHKFIEISKIISLDKLAKFPSNPDTFLEVFRYFEKFQEIAAKIYAFTGNLEALGIQKLDLSKYLWMLELFPILTKINIVLMEIKAITPFHKDFDNLCHYVGKLELFCKKIKADIKEKKIEAPVDPADIDDVFYVVQMTAKEFQQPIYHKGRSVALAYNRMTCVENLDGILTNGALNNTFVILFTAINSCFRYCDSFLQKSLTSFLKQHKELERKNANVILEYFAANKEIAKDNPIVYTFYKSMALFPFQPAKLERCLYEIKIYDYLFYRSAWAGIGPNIKNYLLTIISELNGKQLLSESDMRKWWKEKFVT